MKFGMKVWGLWAETGGWVSSPNRKSKQKLVLDEMALQRDVAEISVSDEVVYKEIIATGSNSSRKYNNFTFPQ